MSVVCTPWRCDPLSRVSALLRILILSALGWWFVADNAQSKEAYLVTYGVGEEVWEWFGHNALWLRDQSQGLDHTFSFGYFDLDASGFYWRFAKGQMRYFGSSVSVEREFAFYRASKRSIRIQRLNLSIAQFDALHQSLTEAIYPYPKYYDYDYYWANCSTWLRDLLDQALGGALSQQLKDRPADASFRVHTARLTAHQPLAQLGLMTILGQASDQDITKWDELFLPEVMANELGSLELNGGNPLVLDDEFLFVATNSSVSVTDFSTQFWLSGLGLVFGLLVVLPLWVSRFRSDWPHQLAVVFVSVVGLIIVWLWFYSEHQVAKSNHLIALANPLFLGLLFLWPKRVQRIAWWMCALSLGLGLVLWALGPVPRQSGEMMGFFLPVAIGILAMSAQRALGVGNQTNEAS